GGQRSTAERGERIAARPFSELHGLDRARSDVEPKALAGPPREWHRDPHVNPPASWRRDSILERRGNALPEAGAARTGRPQCPDRGPRSYPSVSEVVADGGQLRGRQIENEEEVKAP